ncbi:AfsR/SARP family transcriptional regulator [Glycomyces terrestris]|uniref:Tetratricopeptide repeat protein n=1 Tax=Glycomyces terrestris TaxID=2493553 RepID=A0A426V369_9ACTN|nr:BTAD domain-containing putative transcriptional regulator [Glycomyces terrestris]RRS01306.1 tetratricopeptide repeat protein [Glycomyces terrestris]
MPDPDGRESSANTATGPPGGVAFGVLGPLRIAAGGTELELTSPRSRIFTALLVLNPGRQVTLSAFADALWGEELPQNPRRAVQLCAVRVRAQLDRIGAGDLVVTCPDGYRLDVPPEATDIGALADLLREADAAAAGGDAERELAAVAAALELWRGEPLADVPSEALQREAAPGLRERHLQLLERRIEILLHGGGTAELVDELVDLTARHPLREGLSGQLMQALHHCGRRGEALEVYHRFRRRLSDEFGVEPSESIRELHAAILAGRQDDDHGGEPLRLPVPRQLPASAAAFSGRKRELAELDELLTVMHGSSGPVVGVVTGTAGVGKTTLAVHWARRVADEFVDGQLFADLRGYHPGQALPPDRVQARFLRTLGVRAEDLPTEPDELTALFRSTIDGRRLLIVLDNANSADQVRPLLPSGPGCLTVVTSRDALLSLIATDGASRVDLDLFDMAEARELLARRLGAERLAVEPQAADDLIAASARLPLALAIAAARAVIDRSASLSALAGQLREGLDAFGTDSDLTDVRAVFSWSYRALSPGAARMLRLLGLHPGPHLSASAAASLGGLPVPEAGTLLCELTQANLVTEPVPGRFALHDLMREYAVELVSADESEDDRDRAVRRLLDHYLHNGYAAVTVIDPMLTGEAPQDVLPGVCLEEIADHDAAMNWIASEQDALLSIMDWASDAGFDRQAWQLVWVLVPFFGLQSNTAQLLRCMDAALKAGERLGEPLMQARAHRGLGNAYFRAARNEEADRHFALALALYRDTGDLVGEAHVAMGLSAFREQQGRHPEALEHALRALELHERLGDPGSHANALNSVACCYIQVGQHELALDHARRALAAFRTMKAPNAESAALDTIGDAHQGLRQFPEAIDSYQEAVRQARLAGNHFYIARSLDNLGDAYHAAGDRTAARDAWHQAGTILDELQHPAAARVRDKLAQAGE